MGAPRSLAPEEFYHVYNRGTDKRPIFFSQTDYHRFLALLYLCNNTKSVHISNHQGRTLMELLQIERADQLVSIGAYCLMPNHFHLLLQERVEFGISTFMQKLSTGYTMYFNKRNERSGVLFQGKYKHKHVDEDRYLKYLISYIHLNPSIPHEAHSSYLDYSGKGRPESVIIDRNCLPEYFPTPAHFENEMREWLSYREELEQNEILHSLSILE